AICDLVLTTEFGPSVAVRGVVRDDAGRPVSEVVVTYSIAFHHDGVPRPETLGIRPDHDRTGPDGRFEASCELTLRGPRPSFLVAFDDEGTRMAIRLVPAEQLELPQELQLQPTCLVRATLELEGGDPRELPHFMVSWTDPEGRAFTPGIGVDTEAEAGRLRGQVIGRVPPGVYQLQVGKTAQSQAVSIPFEVKSGTRELDLGTHELRISTLAALRGQPAPELAVHAWRPGEPKRLTDLRGKVVVLDFWGYWCVPCLEQMPALMAIAEKFRDQPVVWVAVHTPNVKDFQELDDKLAAVRERLWRGQPLPFATIIDAPDEQDEQHGATATRYGIQLWPTLVVIDQNGNVVDTVAKERLEETLRRLLGR
ncbi:MAG: TlpA family protein disulfide reductase, partial [Planctomycetes bacterium]|nr:TlpA family protein disulfide reductase [Planctomycetota bacterium]